MPSAEETAIEAEFDMLTMRLGIEVPVDLKAGVLRGCQGLRAMTLLLRGVDTHPRKTSGD